MAKYIYKNLQWMVTFVFLAVFAGCMRDDNVLQHSDKTNVRVLTTIDFQFSGPKTRTSGTTTDSSYTTGTENGLADEVKVTTIRVFVFDNTTGELTFQRLFGISGTSGIDEPFLMNGDTYQLDFQIFPGSYEFILIANEDQNWNLTSVTNRDDLNKSVENAISTLETIRIGIPMVGSQEFVIPFDPNSVATRSIDLKRTLAKVEVNLTNQNLATDSVIFATAGVYQIESVALRNINQVYNVLEGDNTAVTESSPLQTITNVVNHVAGDAFTGTILSSYSAERKSVGSDSVMIDLTVLKGSEEVVYSIPVWQFMDDGITKDYNIYRNTLYRVNCILKGTSLTVSLNVLPWELTTSYRDFDSSNTFTEMEFATVWNNDPTTTPPILTQPYVDEATTYTVAKFTFQMEYPQGGIWTATLTNGLDFAFRPGTVITGTSGVLYTVEIVALKPQVNYARSTEFYLMVDGKEIDPDNYYEDGIPRDGTVGIGSGKRFVITQSAR